MPATLALPAEVEQPFRLLNPDGSRHPAAWEGVQFDDGLVVDLHRALVVGRRLDAQAMTLARQGRLTIYPSCRGQEATEVGATRALRDQDWLFPTYRDSVAVLTRGVAPAEAFSLLRGEWHCGWDPIAHRTAPHCTPLATQIPHAAGAALAARRKGSGAAALAFIGDGATSEGDFHEGLNLAAVTRAPLVVVVQNNGWAISVPLHKQTAARQLADKAPGYGVRGVVVDGNDILAVHAVVRDALERAAAGEGPTLVEAMTFRMDAHTSNDDASRYREASEGEEWTAKDPVVRLERFMSERGLLDDDRRSEVTDAAERAAADLRAQLGEEPEVRPEWLFEHVTAQPWSARDEQRDNLLAELEGDAAS